jgi:hypothetical protein
MSNRTEYVAPLFWPEPFTPPVRASLSPRKQTANIDSRAVLSRTQHRDSLVLFQRGPRISNLFKDPAAFSYYLQLVSEITRRDAS